MNILLVKTSSLGDVIHNLPVASDIRAHFPEAQMDWVVEEAFGAIPALHPAVRRVIPVAVRRWRKKLPAPQTWREMREFHRGLQQESYDIVLDTQGLLKSALIARLARGRRCGLDRASAREPLAARFYDRTFMVARNLHAVERNRLLAAQALGYETGNAADYGIRAQGMPFPWLPPGPYAVLLHATSAGKKLWPEAHWIALGGYFRSRGLVSVLPWGNAVEKARSERLAGGMMQALVPPPLGLKELAALLAGAQAVAGVDTGLSHLAAALNTPTAGIYCATDPAATGLYASPRAVNVGGAGLVPAPDRVIAALEKVMAA